MKKLSALIALASLCLCPGCRTVSGGPPPPPPAPEAAAADRAMGDALLSAIKADDYESFAAALPEKCRNPLTAEEFAASRENLTGQFGEIDSWEFVTPLETPLVVNQIWKVGFKRPAADGETVRQELLFRMVTAERDGAKQIIGFGFM